MPTNNGFGAPDDDVYVNDGQSFDTTYYPQEDPERVEAEAKEAAVKAASYPVMGDVAEWFESQIDGCTDIENIQFDVQTISGVAVDRKLSVEAQVLAYRLLKELLIEKYQDFKDFRHER